MQQISIIINVPVLTRFLVTSLLEMTQLKNSYEKKSKTAKLSGGLI
jgi:hypothetical protein